MSVEVAFQVIESLAVVIGVGFAIVQVRQHRREKRREAALELMHSFQTPSFAEAMNLVYNLPDGLSKEEIETLLGEKFHLVYALMTTWESLGILVFRGEVDLDMVDEFFSGPLKISWHKLKGHVMGERELLGLDTIEEWFQWLTERLAEREYNDLMGWISGSCRKAELNQTHFSVLFSSHSLGQERKFA